VGALTVRDSVYYKDMKTTFETPPYEFMKYYADDHYLRAFNGPTGIVTSIDRVSEDNTPSTIQDFRSPEPKLVVMIHSSISHAILDGVNLMTSHFEARPETEMVLLIDVYTNFVDPNQDSRRNLYKTDLIDVAVDILKRRGAKISVVQGLTNHNKLLINNFFAVSSPGYSIPQSINMFSSLNFLADEIEAKDPHRKIYVSRLKTPGRSFSKQYTNESEIKDDLRVFNEEALEEVFVGMGFEVVYLEEVTSFLKQMTMMKEAKVLAGVSGAGLASSVFMKPGGLLVELSALILAPDNDRVLRPTWHHHITEIALSVGVTKLSIPAGQVRDGKLLADQIRNSPLHMYLTSL
jgi:hypothetical protein